MVRNTRLPVFRRMDAAWALAVWEPARVVEMLREAAMHGLAFGEPTTYWRERYETPNSVHIYEFSVPVDRWTRLAARIEAAWVLTALDRVAGAAVFEQMAADEATPLVDRVRIAGELCDLDAERGATQLRRLMPGLTYDRLRTPQQVLALSRSEDESSPAALLRAWCDDQTRPGPERVTAAGALLLLDEELGVEALEQLVFAQETGRQIMDDESAAWAAEVLAEFDQSRAVRALSARIAQGTEVEEFLVALLSDLDRRAAVDSLRRLTSAFPEIEPLLILAELDRNAAEEGLAELITASDSFDDERTQAARALAEWNPVQSAALLTESLRREYWESMHEWRSSFDLLVELDRTGAVDLLSERITDIWQFTSKSAWADEVRWLAELAPGRAESLLRNLSKSRWRRGVRRRAQEMLRELSALPVGGGTRSGQDATFGTRHSNELDERVSILDHGTQVFRGDDRVRARQHRRLNTPRIQQWNPQPPHEHRLFI